MNYSLWDVIQCGVEVYLEGYKLSMDFEVDSEEGLFSYIGFYLGSDVLNKFEPSEEGASQAWEVLVQTVEGERYYEEKSKRSTYDSSFIGG